jgi:NhaA family Na+:H+ antiporter
VLGKTIGIVGCGWFATRIGFPLPVGMRMQHLFVSGLVASLGLTVALFVSSQAFTAPELQGAARMGSVFSAGVALLAWLAAELLGLRPGGSLLARVRRGLRARPHKTEPTRVAAMSGQVDG